MFNANVARPAVLTSLQILLLNINGGIHLTSGFDDICGGWHSPSARQPRFVSGAYLLYYLR